MGAGRVSSGSEEAGRARGGAADENGEPGSRRQELEFREGGRRAGGDPGEPGTHSGSS